MPQSQPDALKRINVQPVKVVKPKRKPGRPKNVRPVVPVFHLEDDELDLYETFIASFMNDYPDIKDYPSDMLLLPLAAVEYVKYLRVINSELATREAIMISRQHPATQFFRILDMMHVTRKARTRFAKPQEDDTSDFLKALSLEG